MSKFDYDSLAADNPVIEKIDNSEFDVVVRAQCRLFAVVDEAFLRISMQGPLALMVIPSRFWHASPSPLSYLQPPHDYVLAFGYRASLSYG
ncbi:hypothetical protein M404DRAFT_560701 [Pisolithus tinctorius Marx 270]|uniref:Uncharacterized protein n=1 Tax=Pisolithus tinctorius Marx 270 TaxID=870435 RepID=A0A0C3JVG4_PISTI|nr:hypothetical protein M404DRAFT_560701 [Pisolithus tinctorius Marx 270]